MCTVTWIHEDGGYQLFCNRDEKVTRRQATPPSVTVREGVRFLAPVDGDFGGTWIATNELGVSLCLLNGGNAHGAMAARSRGLLVLDLIPLPSIAAICAFVQAADLSAYAPFTLAALEPGKSAAVVEWNGSRTTIRYRAEPHFMLTSSSFDTEEVTRNRAEEYARLINAGVDANRLVAFHQSHQPARSAYSVCMHRHDAETVSFSRIRVAHGQTDFFYSPGAPCECGGSVNGSEPLVPLLRSNHTQLGLGNARSIVRSSNRLR